MRERQSVAAHAGDEGLQDMRIIEAIYESARTGAVVKLPVPPVRVDRTVEDA